MRPKQFQVFVRKALAHDLRERRHVIINSSDGLFAHELVRASNFDVTAVLSRRLDNRIVYHLGTELAGWTTFVHTISHRDEMQEIMATTNTIAYRTGLSLSRPQGP